MDTKKIITYSVLGLVSIIVLVVGIRYFGNKSQSTWRYR